VLPSEGWNNCTGAWSSSAWTWFKSSTSGSGALIACMLSSAAPLGCPSPVVESAWSMLEILTRVLGEEITRGEEEKKPCPENRCLFFFVNIVVTAAPKRFYTRDCVRVGMWLHLMRMCCIHVRL
jgi:hypothetical protein